MKLPFTLPIETERLILRSAEPGDTDALLTYHGDSEICRYLPYEPRGRDEVEKSMQRRLGFTEFKEDAEPFFLHVILKETGELIGDFVLFCRNDEAKQGEIGYVFSKKFQRKGYALEAAKKVMEIGFDGFDCHRIEAKCSAANVPSWKLMEKLGMRREALFIENEIFKGEWDDLMIYAVLQREWHEREA